MSLNIPSSICLCDVFNNNDGGHCSTHWHLCQARECVSSYSCAWKASLSTTASSHSRNASSPVFCINHQTRANFIIGVFFLQLNCHLVAGCDNDDGAKRSKKNCCCPCNKVCFFLQMSSFHIYLFIFVAIICCVTPQ